MSENKTTIRSVSGSFTSLLAVAFIVLKLCGVIGWSWWWVTAPLWGPLALIVAAAIVAWLIVATVWLVVFVFKELAIRRNKSKTREIEARLIAQQKKFEADLLRNK